MKNAKSEIPENVDCVSLIPFDLIRWKLHTYIYLYVGYVLVHMYLVTFSLSQNVFDKK